MKFVLFMLVVAVGTRESHGRKNVAVGKPVSGIRLQQDTQDTLPYLVDRIPNTCADSGPLVTRPAFQIDLGGDHLVQGVKLVFPNDCTQTLSKTGCVYGNTVIRVSGEQNSKGEVCVRIQNDVLQSKGELPLDCEAGAVIGRYITLIKEDYTYSHRAIYLCELEIYGQGRKNVALNKKVTGVRLQQDTLHTLPYLVDDIPNTCADSGPAMTRPAFQIDLGHDHLVQGVKLGFPNDCSQTVAHFGCGYHDTVISVSVEQNSNGEVCVRIKDDVYEPKGELTLECKAGAVIGRYVTLTKEIESSLPRAIHLCELKVYGQGRQNIALDKAVTGIGLEQGTLHTLPYLVDGIPNTCADSGSKVTRPSFQIDLGRDHLVKGIKLVFPNDCTQTVSEVGCGYNETVICVSDEQNIHDEVCVRIQDDVFQPKGDLTLECNAGAVMGRYVTLIKETSSPRSIYLCELKVYRQDQTNVALNKPVTGIGLEQGTLHTLPYLVDGIPNTCADSGQAVNRPSFQIDLGRDHLVQGVKLVFPNNCTQTLSKDGCGYQETVISVIDEQNSNDEVCVRIQDDAFQPERELTLECNAGAQIGRYITLMKENSSPRAIYLCELKVYGQSINSDCERKTWRDDLRCGPSFPLPNGCPAECDPNGIYPCCSPAGWCGATADHCTCCSCIDFRSNNSDCESKKWRDDLRCGPDFPLPDGSPAECDPNGTYPCCSPAGWCGVTAAHCTCCSCTDYRKKRCGPNFSLVDGDLAKCDPDDIYPCCSPAGWYWNTSSHCTCDSCLDYRRP